MNYCNNHFNQNNLNNGTLNNRPIFNNQQQVEQIINNQ